MDYSKITDLLKQKRITQKELAEKAGISTGGLQNVLYNKNTTIETLEKLSKALDVPMVYWFQEEEIESKVATEKGTNNLKSEIKRLNSLIDDLTDDKRRLKRDNDELRGKLGMSKATG